ncbi:hypothetical protein GOC74_05315 [Halomicrobium mukohataei]|uniref:Uncharacterized protein n=1 Tax=Halomicrobium mukohataei TaxID=57705 RepID=A0A847UE38_9EURY|nr:hypothetical protein [Halomicrobium mukohataei]NLV09348.1 hypothetical protein [Halomicrobium mukohataei]
MTGPECPAEGCDYNEDGEKSKKSVRRHINAKADDAHEDTEALRAALMEQTSTADEGDEGDDDPPGTGGAAATEDDEQGEPAVEDAESGTEAGNEYPEEGDDMDQSDEYEQQLQQQGAESSGESTDGSGTDGQDDRAQSDASSGSSGRSGLAILGGTIALLVAFLVATSGDSDNEDEPVEVESEVSDAGPVDEGETPQEVF